MKWLLNIKAQRDRFRSAGRDGNWRGNETSSDDVNVNLVAPSTSFDYYTETIYWNSFEIVQEHWNRSISGSKDAGWIHHLGNKLGSFQRAYSLNCGNGWVERDLFRLGVIKQVFGIDFLQQNIEQATEEARKINMPANYSAADCNNFDPSGLRIDLVVNYAAMHHVAYINKVTRHLAELIRPAGYYVGLDYVGPHRNQYPANMWAAMVEFNRSLPTRYQANLKYPDMKAMLRLDPTEAIHSELQLEVMRRYFDIQEYVELGGPIAYHILYENKALFGERNSIPGREVLQEIMAADKQLVERQPDFNLFAFWIAKPKFEDFPPHHQIKKWQHEEDDRENAAARNEGRYYPETELEILSRCRAQ